MGYAYGYAYSMLMDYLWIACGCLMYARQLVNPSVHPSVRPSVHPPAHLSTSHPSRPSAIHPCIWLAIRLSFQQSLHTSSPSARPPFHLSLAEHLMDMELLSGGEMYSTHLCYNPLRVQKTKRS